jgi:hypothetical protein
MRMLTGTVIAAFGGAAMLALSLSPASAFTLSGPSMKQSVASSQVDQVYWRRGWGGRRWGWGWGPGAVVGGLAAGALVAGYYGGYYGPGYYGYGPGYYGPGPGRCWRDGWGRVSCY